MKETLKKLLPNSIQQTITSFKYLATIQLIKTAEFLGYNISKKTDYYSPLPTLSNIQKNKARWDKPSPMNGISYDVSKYKLSLQQLVSKYGEEFNALASYEDNKLLGFGPGYTELDAYVLYMMIRAIKPKRYFEVGSGLSTYYSNLAAKKNATEGNPIKIKCIEPFPFEQLSSIEHIEIIQDEVQNVKKTFFSELESNDVLFIDSSHVIKIDGDVPFLFLEILPLLNKGIIVHIHDIPFPFNTPYPAKQWVTDSPYAWPMYWNEAMLLQAFLMYNETYEIIQSTPLIRYYDEPFLKNNIPFYKSIEEEPNTFSSIWLKKVK